MPPRHIPLERTSLAERSLLLYKEALHGTQVRSVKRVIVECLKFREAKQPDAWNTFNAQSLLGDALLGQKKYSDAEPLLLKGYERMKQREDKIPPQGKIRLRESLERLVQLYEATGNKDEAAKWRGQFQLATPRPDKPKS